MKTKIIIALNKILEKFNAKIISKKLDDESIMIDFRENDKISTNDLENVITSYHKPISFIFNIPTDKIMYNRFLSVWINTLKLRDKEIEKEDFKERESFKYYKNYYKNYTPDTVGDILENKDPNSDYFSLPALYYIFPWYYTNHVDSFKGTINSMKREYEELTNKKYLNDGHKAFGPCSDRWIEFEYLRLTNIFDSIKAKGYIQNEEFLSFYIYKKDEDYLYNIHSGLHRMASLLALNYTYIPAAFSINKIKMYNNNIINKNDYKEWPQVTNGLFTEEQALQLFDNTFKPMLDNLNTTF